MFRERHCSHHHSCARCWAGRARRLSSLHLRSGALGADVSISPAHFPLRVGTPFSSSFRGSSFLSGMWSLEAITRAAAWQPAHSRPAVCVHQLTCGPTVCPQGGILPMNHFFLTPQPCHFSLFKFYQPWARRQVF